MYLIALEGLEAATGSKSKEEWLEIALKDPDMHKIFDATYNFSRKFFIKQIPELSEAVSDIGGHLSEFLDLLNKLEKRTVVGDAARLAVKTLLDQCSFLERKWFTRILLKDLRCGVGISSVNKVGFKIPEFEVMLAKDGKSCKTLNTMIKKGVWVSKKLDGYRCLAIVEDGQATLFTRQGKQYENFPQIEKALLEACKNASGPLVLDGEIMSNDFQSIQKSAFASKRGTTVGDVCYHIFDLIPHDEWSSQQFTTTAARRFHNLTDFFKSPNIDGQKLKLVEHTLHNNLDDIVKLEQQFISEGFEGAMVLPDIPYYLGRKSNTMLKFKTMLTMDCVVTGHYLGEGKYENTLGGLIVQQENGKECRVGSGFIDQERDDILNDITNVVGRTIEVKYQNLSDDGVMRFPIFLRFRDQGASSGKI
jgi:DNA ligase-1